MSDPNRNPDDSNSGDAGLQGIVDTVAGILDLPESDQAAAFRQLRELHPEHSSQLERMEQAAAHLPDGADRLAAITRQMTLTGDSADDRPDRVGPYKILDVLGEGGMGTVYLAEQKEPVRRRVALKLIKLGMDSKQVLNRFEAERQALAMMEHSNIAKVFDGGITEHGRPFFVMEYVKGEPMTDFCDRNRLTIGERLNLFQQVCGGVQHAHQKGIIHRDLKPSNILVSQQEGVPVPKIIDFGLARATDNRLVEATIFTEQGQIIGTPEYMSPEQADLGGLDVDTRTDVYSLGVVLYELLTGQLPFAAAELPQAGFLELQRKIKEDEPPKPSTRVSALDEELGRVADRRRIDRSSWLRSLRGDLDWIAMKALEKDPARRYQAAITFAQDIARNLCDEPVEARPPSVSYRLQKFVRKNRIAVVGAALVVLSLMGGIIAFAVANERARDNEVTATREAEKATRLQGIADERATKLAASERSARWRTYTASLFAAQAAIRENDLKSAREYLRGCDKELRGFEWRYLQRALDTSLATLRRDEASPSISLGPQGAEILRARGPGIDRLDTRTGKSVGRFEKATDDITCFAAASSGRIVAGTSQGTVHVWDSDGRRTEAQAAQARPVEAVALSSDGAKVVYSIPPMVYSWEPYWPSGRFSWLEGRTCLSLAVVDGDRFVAGTRAGGIWLIDGAAQSERAKLRLLAGHRGAVHGLAVDPSGKRLASASGDATVRVWGLASGKTEALMHGHQGGVVDVSWASKETLVTAGEDGTVRVWNVADARETAVLRGHVGGVRSIATEAERIFSQGHDGSLRRWSMNSELNAPIAARGRLLAAVPRGGLLVGDGRHIDFLDASNGLTTRGVTGHRDEVLALVTTSDARTLRAVSADLGGRVRFWDLERGEIVARPDERFAPVRALAVSGNGERVWIGCDDGTVRAWDITGQACRPAFQISSRVRALALCAGEERLAVSTDASTIATFDIASKRQVGELTGHSASVTCLASFGVDGLVSGSDDGTLRVWSLGQGTSLNLTGHSGPVTAIAVDATGSRIATGSTDRTVRLWSVRNGDSLLILRGHEATVTALAFGADGTQLWSADAEAAVRSWQTEVSMERVEARLEARPRARQAEALAEALVREGIFLEASCEVRLRADPKVSTELRVAVVRLIARRQNPRAFNDIAWDLVRNQDGSETDVRRAVPLAEAACALRPDNLDYRNTLGVALYRAGRFDDAIVALRECVDKRGQANSDDLAFLAMALRRSGDQAKAAEVRERFARRAASESIDARYLALCREVDAAFSR